MTADPFAYVAGAYLTDLREVADLVAEPELLDRGGHWAVVATFEGAVTGYRFGIYDERPWGEVLALAGGPVAWPGVATSWVSSLDRAGYIAGVVEVQRRIAAGDLRQVNLCRVLTAELAGDGFGPLGLSRVLAAGNPARYGCVVSTGSEWIVGASPELFLRREGDLLVSSPIKGTARPGQPFAEKDGPENLLVTDLVRGELRGICGSVTDEALLTREELPGLSHLVSTVSARLRPGVGWGEILRTMLPPASVSGVPKLAAVAAISELEPVPRGVYCGAVGYVSGDRAELAASIRTFFTSAGGRRLHFGTGAGITYDSDPAAEWDETELKASRLIALV